MFTFVLTYVLSISCFLTAACISKVGWPVKERTHKGSIGATFVAPKQQFFCDGEVTMWRYQAHTSNGFQAIVFRPLDAGHTQFQIVGINNIPSNAIDIPVSYTVPEGDRIKVQRGDVIGWSSVVIPFDERSDGSNLVRWINKNQYSLHDNITFGGLGSCEYSIEATLHVSMTINQP